MKAKDCEQTEEVKDSDNDRARLCKKKVDRNKMRKCEGRIEWRDDRSDGGALDGESARVHRDTDETHQKTSHCLTLVGNWSDQCRKFTSIRFL